MGNCIKIDDLKKNGKMIQKAPLGREKSFAVILSIRGSFYVEICALSTVDLCGNW